MSTKALGNMDKCMGLANPPTLMMQAKSKTNTSGSSRRDKSTVLGNIDGLTVQSTKVNGLRAQS